jgi:hypothetical protein
MYCAKRKGRNNYSFFKTALHVAGALGASS